MTPAQRSDIETCLDRMRDELVEAGRFRYPLEGLYLRAIRIVREVPAGTRRIRKDFGARRPGRQQGLDIA